MQTLSAISRFIDAMNDRIGRVMAWLALITVLVAAWAAIVRYLDKYLGTSLSSNTYNELQWYLYAVMFFMLAPHTMLKNGHVRVDILASRFPKRTQRIIEIIGSLVFTFPLCLLIIVLSWGFVTESIRIGEISNDPGGLPRWPIKLFIPIGLSLLGLQALSEGLKKIVELNAGDKDNDGVDAMKGAV